MNPDQVLDQIIQANPKPADAQAPSTVLTRAALLVELDRRSGDMQTQDKPASQKTKPTSPPTSPSRPRRLVPALASAGAVMVALVIAVVLLSSDEEPASQNAEAAAGAEAASSRIETFTYTSNGIPTRGKIYIPASYETNKALPAVYLLDIKEQNYEVATDEFEVLISAVEGTEDFDALVVTHEGILDGLSTPESWPENSEMFTDMAAYVDSNYTSSTSRTIVGRGNAANIVLAALFLEDPETSLFDRFVATDPNWSTTEGFVDMVENGEYPDDKRNKKLHFSFSESNIRFRVTGIINTLTEAELPWLEFTSVEYADVAFEDAYPIAFAEGIEYVSKD